MFIDEIKDKHKGHDVYIIGKGISLLNLKREMIGEGVVITINDAIRIIESLNLTNLTYSMQKDGPGGNFQYNKIPDPATLICNDCSKHTFMPERSILLVHKHESLNCSPDYKPRMVFDNLELGLNWYSPSVLSAIKIAEVMGCKKLYFVSFDAVTTGDCRSVSNATKGGNHEPFAQKKLIMSYLEKIDHEWITP